MNSTEKLQRIRALCIELLALAEKRTPGRWNSSVPTGKWVQLEQPRVTGLFAVADNPTVPQVERSANSLFVASCAGAAEAGWRSTIETINDLLAGCPHACTDGKCPGDRRAAVKTAKLIADWWEVVS